GRSAGRRAAPAARTTTPRAGSTSACCWRASGPPSPSPPWSSGAVGAGAAEPLQGGAGPRSATGAFSSRRPRALAAGRGRGRVRDAAGEQLGDAAQLRQLGAAGRAAAQMRRQLVRLVAVQPPEGVDAEADA